ncbi:MAG: hypothetical protein V4691_01775 [Pseudomonadota bacterium]
MPVSLNDAVKELAAYSLGYAKKDVFFSCPAGKSCPDEEEKKKKINGVLFSWGGMDGDLTNKEMLKAFQNAKRWQLPKAHMQDKDTASFFQQIDQRITELQSSLKPQGYVIFPIPAITFKRGTNGSEIESETEILTAPKKP